MNMDQYFLWDVDWSFIKIIKSIFVTASDSSVSSETLRLNVFEGILNFNFIENVYTEFNAKHHVVNKLGQGHQNTGKDIWNIPQVEIFTGNVSVSWLGNKGASSKGSVDHKQGRYYYVGSGTLAKTIVGIRFVWRMLNPGNNLPIVFISCIWL